MKLSVVIVNYNVRHFLEQCLKSVERAMAGIEGEVFVVDNDSTDGSVEMVRSKFPWVILIENRENVGFSKANNQAISISKGEYVLLLNPDTVVEEDTFSKCVSFMDAHPDAGGLGVKMIDGKGKFLPESKRGMPSPAVAFWKISGLSSIFPKSRTFGRYHLGFLDENKTHEVEILAGAFMWMRKSVLDKVGLLDETFFMYGEDIDLSYRILQGGYKNYYLPDTRIIHYKGESTKKSSVNYVMVFYKAMVIFAKKHFSPRHASVFSFLINLAVYLRAALAISNRLAKSVALPVLDGSLLLVGMYFLKIYWEHIVKGLDYPPLFMWLVLPAYVLIWICSIYASGGYDRPMRISKAVRGVFSGSIFILVVYSLLSEEYRFSRAMIVLGTVWATVSITSVRLLLDLLKLDGFRLQTSQRKNLIIVAGSDEGKRVLSILQSSGTKVNFLGFVSVSKTDGRDYDGHLLGDVDTLDDIVSMYDVNEIIFCAKDLSSQDIINRMLQLNRLDLEYKIAPPESLFIIGSNSINDNGDLYLMDVDTITSPSNRRKKRMFDVSVSLISLLLYPILAFVVRSPSGLISNIFEVLFGKLTWVGLSNSNKNIGRTAIRKGVLTPYDVFEDQGGGQKELHIAARLDSFYARDYAVAKDLKILYKSFRNMGRR
ncbi:MAG: glycosyltransferase [Bacteroidota bacterium]|jgi:GT2 family glycosyltransferase